MPIEQFSTAAETMSAIRERIRATHREFAGVQLRAAHARVQSRPVFLTGTMVFFEEEQRGRETADYGQILLSESWIGGVEAALTLAGQLFRGEESIGGTPVPNLFNRSIARRDLSGHSISGWPSWIYEVSVDPTGGQHRFNLEPMPAIAKGLPPFKSSTEAVTDWMGESLHPRVVGGNVPHQDQFVIVIPDTRARFKYGRWSPGTLVVEVELNTEPQSIELQVIHGGAKSRFASHAISPGEMVLSVPEDASDLSLYLIHSDGRLLAMQTLPQVYRSFGPVELDELNDQSRWQGELQKGENERREFKPFIAANDRKEREIVKSAVAFANTDGGTIFVGVDDEGVPLGIGEASKCHKCKEPIEAQLVRLKNLIRESTQPVPSTSCRIVMVGGHPIIVLEVEKSETICTTHDNRSYIRRGATNRIADPRTELPILSKASSSDLWEAPFHSDIL